MSKFINLLHESSYFMLLLCDQMMEVSLYIAHIPFIQDKCAKHEFETMGIGVMGIADKNLNKQSVPVNGLCVS